ncbi:MAG: response regulator [Desulfamplus sp.]|nr:response regulator [Desulfamplus sp.]
MSKNPDILTIPQAAQYCGVTRMSMWRWVKAGKINSFVTPGGHHRIIKSDLEKALKAQGMKMMIRQIDAPAKILVVDDNELVVKGIEKLFLENNFEVETARDGFEAGVKAKQFNPDLIILDLMMPNMDGFEACRFIKNNDSTSHIKILILTGHASKENEEEILDAGADDLMEKPVDNEELIYKTEDLLRDLHWVKDHIRAKRKRAYAARRAKK